MPDGRADLSADADVSVARDRAGWKRHGEGVARAAAAIANLGGEARPKSPGPAREAAMRRPIVERGHMQGRDAGGRVDIALERVRLDRQRGLEGADSKGHWRTT